MKLTEKLKEYEGQFMFIRWATGGEYGKLKYVGTDFVEFESRVHGADDEG